MVTKKQMVENHQTLVGSALLGWTTTGAFAFLKWASLPKQEADTDAIGRRRRGRRTRIVAVSLPQNNLSGRSARFWAVHMDTEFGTPLCGDGVHAWTSAQQATICLHSYPNPVLLLRFMNNPCFKIEYNRNIDSCERRRNNLRIFVIYCLKQNLDTKLGLSPGFTSDTKQHIPQNIFSKLESAINPSFKV